MRITITESYNDKLNKSLTFWKREPTKQKVRAIMLDLLNRQRMSGLLGKNNARNLPVVEVSKTLISDLFSDITSQKRFRLWVESSGLVIKDRSWVSATIAEDAHQDPHPDSWHLTEDETTGRSIEVQYDPRLGIYSSYCKVIKQVDGLAIAEGDTHIFNGSKALDDYTAGRLEWGDLDKVVELAHNISRDLKGKKKLKGPSCRTYDAVALCKKELRTRYIVDSRTGRGMEEFFDVNAASTLHAKIGAAGVGVEGFCDTDVKGWANSLIDGTATDKYEYYYRKLVKAYPMHHLYESDTWNEGIRECLKTDVQVVLNCSLPYIIRCEKAFHKREWFDDSVEYLTKRRQWCVWTMLHNVDRTLWCLSLTIKINEYSRRRALKKLFDDKEITEVEYRHRMKGTKDGFFRLHTLGEKMLMSFLVEKFKQGNICVHRVHDALWSADERLLNASSAKIDEIVGKLIWKAFSGPIEKVPMTGIKKLYEYISEEETDWVKEVLTLDDEQKKLFKDVEVLTTKP